MSDAAINLITYLAVTFIVAIIAHIIGEHNRKQQYEIDSRLTTREVYDKRYGYKR